MGVNGKIDQYEWCWFQPVTHPPPKMFVDLNFTIINLTNLQIIHKYDQPDQYPI